MKIVEAHTNHIPDIANLYEAVHINELNVAGKLNQYHRDNFSKTGGIFQKLSEATLTEMVCNPQYYILVVLEQKKLIGYSAHLIHGVHTYRNWVITPQYSTDSLSEITKFNHSLQKGKVAYGIDVIISPDCRRKGLRIQLNKYASKWLKNQGCTHKFFEIYCVTFDSFQYSNPNNSICTEMSGSHIVGYRLKEHHVGDRIIPVKSYVHILKL